VPVWPDHPLGRSGPGHGQARARQPGHQHDPPRLVRDPSRTNLKPAPLQAGPPPSSGEPIQHRHPACITSRRDPAPVLTAPSRFFEVSS
jgi:hypothetical protein